MGHRKKALKDMVTENFSLEAVEKGLSKFTLFVGHKISKSADLLYSEISGYLGALSCIVYLVACHYLTPGVTEHFINYNVCC